MPIRAQICETGCNVAGPAGSTNQNSAECTVADEAILSLVLIIMICVRFRDASVARMACRAARAIIIPATLNSKRFVKTA